MKQERLDELDKIAVPRELAEIQLGDWWRVEWELPLAGVRASYAQVEEIEPGLHPERDEPVLTIIGRTPDGQRISLQQYGDYEVPQAIAKDQAEEAGLKHEEPLSMGEVMAKTAALIEDMRKEPPVLTDEQLDDLAKRASNKEVYLAFDAEAGEPFTMLIAAVQNAGGFHDDIAILYAPMEEMRLIGGRPIFFTAMAMHVDNNDTFRVKLRDIARKRGQISESEEELKARWDAERELAEKLPGMDLSPLPELAAERPIVDLAVGDWWQHVFDDDGKLATVWAQVTRVDPTGRFGSTWSHRVWGIDSDGDQVYVSEDTPGEHILSVAKAEAEKALA